MFFVSGTDKSINDKHRVNYLDQNGFVKEEVSQGRGADWKEQDYLASQTTDFVLIDGNSSDTEAENDEENDKKYDITRESKHNRLTEENFYKANRMKSLNMMNN